jgi:hypothetical protein
LIKFKIIIVYSVSHFTQGVFGRRHHIYILQNLGLVS